jgi:squalene synthase HpnC
MRPHVAAVYAFARTADDAADEWSAPAADRLAALNRMGERLREAIDAERRGAPGDPERDDDLMVAALAHSILRLDLPLTLFDDLLSAFGQDTMTTRYASWADVFDYCRRSANPIGRLVLRIAGYHDAALERSSDALCSALQLTNFWQDLGRDWRAGRLYVPSEAQARAGADEAGLERVPLPESWGRAIEECVDVTRTQFDEGRAVCDLVRGRLRIELRFTWLGGVRTLERAAHVREFLIRDRPALGVLDAPVLLWRAARWRVRR